MFNQKDAADPERLEDLKLVIEYYRKVAKDYAEQLTKHGVNAEALSTEIEAFNFDPEASGVDQLQTAYGFIVRLLQKASEGKKSDEGVDGFLANFSRDWGSVPEGPLAPEHLTDLRKARLFFPDTREKIGPFEGKLGLTWVVWLELHGFSVVGLTRSIAGSHGAGMSPEHFARHDDGHGFVIRIMDGVSVKQFSDGVFELLKSRGVDEDVAGDVASAVSFDRYHHIQGLMRNMLEHAQRTFLVEVKADKSDARQKFNGTVSCLFFILHEALKLKVDPMKAKTDAEMLRHLFSAIKASFDEGVETFDPLETNWQTGKPLDESKSTELLFSKKHQIDASYGIEVSELTFGELDTRGFWIGTAYGALHTVVQIKKNAEGEVIDGTYISTARFRLGEAEDANGLLRLAGCAADAPTREALEGMTPVDARDAIKDFLSRVRDAFSGLADTVLGEYLADLDPSRETSGAVSGGGGGSGGAPEADDSEKFTREHPRTAVLLKGRTDADAIREILLGST